MLHTFINRAATSLMLVVFLVAGTLQAAAITTGPVGPAWDNPSAMSLRSLGTMAPTGEAHLAFEDNLDCVKSSYRLNGTSVQQIGCYEPSAYGAIDVENGLISFNGNEETVVPLLGFSPHEVLLPWPGTEAVLSIVPTAAGDGAYLGLYRNILAATSDQRNLLGQVVAKQVTRPADFPLLDPASRKLIVNFNSLAFSDSGAWLVAESLSGLFYRINLATLTAKPFAPSYSNLGSGYNQSQVAITPDGDYVAIANSAAHSLRVYNLANCPGPVNENSVCPSYDYWSYIKTKASTFTHPVHARFLNNGLLSFVDLAPTGQTTYELAPTGDRFALLDYLALGDSFTSGEGAFNYRLGTDTADNSCHASTKAYPAVLTHQLFTTAGGNSVACSGARLADISGGPDYRGQVSGGIPFSARSAGSSQQLLNLFSPGVLPQASFMSHYQPATLTVSIGGNDIGFGSILKLCVAPHVNPHVTNANACYNTYEDRLELARVIDDQVPRLTRLFKRLHELSPATTIYAVGYPLIAVDTGSCAINVHLNTTELALSIEVTKELNNAIARAAAASGANYVDIENALVGHRLCEVKSDLVAVNGLTAGNDGGFGASVAGHSVTIDFLGKESFHPTAYGQQLIAEAILLKTHNLQLKLPISTSKPSASSPGTKLLQAPKTGRAITRKAPATVSKNKSVKRGATVPIAVNGRQHGARSNSSHTVKLKQGSVVTPIGVITSGPDGSLNGTVTIPPTTVPGTYEIDIDGDDQLGSPVSMIDVITIIDSDTDYDGDTTPDTVNGCPTIKNSGIDSDHDGLDDACDGIIGISSGNNPPTTNPITPVPSSTPSSTTPQLPLPSTIVPPSPSTTTTETPQFGDLLAATIQPAAGNVPVQKNIALNQPVLSSPLNTISKVSVTPASNQTSVLGVTTTANKSPLLSPSKAGSSSPAPKPWRKLPHIPWLWLMVAYVLTWLVYVQTKRARHSQGSSWRRKRDSNPRYP